MTTLYRPVLIESAEQAEALPVETVATHGEHWPVVRCTPHRWESSARDMGHEELIGWTALVPIEVGEEYAVRLGSEGGMILPVATREPAPGHGGVNNLTHLARYVTRWEEA